MTFDTIEALIVCKDRAKKVRLMFSKGDFWMIISIKNDIPFLSKIFCNIRVLTSDLNTLEICRFCDHISK